MKSTNIKFISALLFSTMVFFTSVDQVNAQIRRPAPTGQVPKTTTGQQTNPYAGYNPKPTGQIAPAPTPAAPGVQQNQTTDPNVQDQQVIQDPAFTQPVQTEQTEQVITTQETQTVPAQQTQPIVNNQGQQTNVAVPAQQTTTTTRQTQQNTNQPRTTTQPVQQQQATPATPQRMKP
ncbi:hypothetical protein [Dyadobacter arcticus]|uniref:Uncharacterized protein n=1 Tax=Dyadobacter arcticus TaxID=1078754 RepID=A0ABX0UQE5_9BACT|nr:hypothetical protein [Dyadobacter arcticus]NIJ53905.1 hypothetical protein [Dyadobacter arcticus]